MAMRVRSSLSVLPLVFILIAIATFTGSASAVTECADLLATYAAKTLPQLVEQKDSGVVFIFPFTRFKIRKDSVATTKVVSQGLWGQERRLVQRVRDSWYSSRKINLNPHGNVLNLITVLGPEAALFFGFQMVSPTELWVPSPFELNAAIDVFNRGLEYLDQIPFHFFGTENFELESNAYVSEFTKGRLPYARGGFFEIHDISYHLGQILLPQAVFLTLKRNIEMANRSSEYIQSTVVDNSAIQIDLLGNLTLFLLDQPNPTNPNLTPEKFGSSIGILPPGESSRWMPKTAQYLSVPVFERLLTERNSFVRTRAEDLLSQVAQARIRSVLSKPHSQR